MGLRPFARHPKQKVERGETTPEGLNQVAQFFSGDLHPEDPAAAVGQPDQQLAQQVPSVVLEQHRGAGWYPDAADPGMMRYWDGFHLTGQVMHVHARAGEADAKAPTATTADAEAPTATTADAEEPSVNSSGRAIGTRATDQRATDKPAIDKPSIDKPSIDKPFSDLRATDLLAPFGSSLASAGETRPVAERSEKGADPTPPSVGVNSPLGAPPAAETNSIEPRHSPTAPSADRSHNGTAALGLEDTEADDEETRGGSAVAPDGFAGHDRGNQDSTVPTGGSSGKPGRREGAEDEAGHWAEQTERAVARARELGTPDAWKEAAQVALVVSEMAQIMQAAAEASQVAEDMDQAARVAAEEAEAAAQTASKAERSAKETAQAAQEAAEAAKAADQAADHAKRTAEVAAEAAPRLAEVAAVAAEAAAGAEHKARNLDEIVSRACTANTPAAWSEALSLSSKATKTEEEADRAGGGSAAARPVFRPPTSPV